MTAHPLLPPESPVDHLRNALAILVTAKDPSDPSTATYLIEDLTRALELLRTAVEQLEVEQLDREDEPDDREPPPPSDFGPPGSGAVIIEYVGNEPGLEDGWDHA